MPFQTHAYREKWLFCVREINRKPKHMEDLQTILFCDEEEEYDLEDDPEDFGPAVVESDEEE